MKKILSILTILSVAVAAQAQTWDDAYLFSSASYGGTARGVGLGNALTAVGGDPGSVNLNPAGSAVASYSQFMITPGLSIASTSATGTLYNGSAVGFGDNVISAYTRMKLPNVGFVISANTGQRSGLKRISWGMLVNSTNDFTRRMNASGYNSSNSFAASLASSADGFSKDVMANAGWNETGDLSRMPRWIDLAGYRSGIFGAVTGKDGTYIALTEIMDEDGNFKPAGEIYQKYGAQTYGSKNDIVINLAADFSDKFYIGANLGFTALSYDIVEYWNESPADPSEFPDIEYSDGTKARFVSLDMKRRLRLSGTGVYFKVGAIWLPFRGLRLGAAIQTPTVFNLTERYGYSATASLSGKSTSSVSSPEDRWQYDMTSPFRANFGAALSLGTLAVISADYEIVNYSQARYRDHYTDSDSVFADGTFTGVNGDIKSYLGASHALRAGVEVKPVPAFAIRAGYNLTTSGIKDGSESAVHAVSAGLGFSSSGALYADLAFRMRFMPTSYVIPYYYYTVPDPSKYWDKYIDDSVLTPEIASRTTLSEIFLTIGWRF